jgi:hypothetical protein
VSEQELRDLYIRAVFDVAGAAPASIFDQKLSPLLIRFAELVQKETVDKAVV